MSTPKTSYHADVYGVFWLGKLGGWRAVPGNCAAVVGTRDDCSLRQCARKRGHGPEQAFCRPHASMYESGDRHMLARPEKD